VACLLMSAFTKLSPSLRDAARDAGEEGGVRERTMYFDTVRLYYCIDTLERHRCLTSHGVSFYHSIPSRAGRSA
jgi:hypothetical protein